VHAVTTALEQARKAELQAGNLAAAIDEASETILRPTRPNRQTL